MVEVPAFSDLEGLFTDPLTEGDETPAGDDGTEKKGEEKSPVTPEGKEKEKPAPSDKDKAKDKPKNEVKDLIKQLQVKGVLEDFEELEGEDLPLLEGALSKHNELVAKRAVEEFLPKDAEQRKVVEFVLNGGNIATYAKNNQINWSAYKPENITAKNAAVVIRERLVQKGVKPELIDAKIAKLAEKELLVETGQEYLEELQEAQNTENKRMFDEVEAKKNQEIAKQTRQQGIVNELFKTRTILGQEIPAPLVNKLKEYLYKKDPKGLTGREKREKSLTEAQQIERTMMLHLLEMESFDFTKLSTLVESKKIEKIGDILSRAAKSSGTSGGSGRGEGSAKEDSDFLDGMA